PSVIGGTNMRERLMLPFMATAATRRRGLVKAHENLIQPGWDAIRYSRITRSICSWRQTSIEEPPIQLGKAPAQRECSQASDSEQAQGRPRFRCRHRPKSHVKLIVGGGGVSLLNQERVCSSR